MQDDDDDFKLARPDKKNDEESLRIDVEEVKESSLTVAVAEEKRKLLLPP